jgi:hypothetical protein
VGADEADIGGHEVAGGEPDDVTGHEIGDGDLALVRAGLAHPTADERRRRGAGTQ